MRLYITGIKSLADAEKAVAFGASAVGIKMGYEKDLVHPETARDIFLNLPVFISRVGIFADEKRYNVQELVTFCRLDTLHFIGSEQPEDLKRYSEHILKNFDPKDLTKVQDYDLHGVVIDLQSGLSKYVEVEMENIKKQSLILSGDLTLTEWIDAVKNFHPYAVQLDLTYYHKDPMESFIPLLSLA
ncbi:MAG: hypothetical protein AAGU27_09620 [Dehalobacterium sp.]